MSAVPPDELSARYLSENLRMLRELRGLSQDQLARMAGIPRPTWTALESGSANPTLSVLLRAARALGVSIDELINQPKALVRHYPASQLPTHRRGGVVLRSLLPDPLPGLTIERMELSPDGRMVGVPHTSGTREYLCCEVGTIQLSAGGERFTLAPGDVVVFRGDQNHSYYNPGAEVAVAYSAVVVG